MREINCIICGGSVAEAYAAIGERRLVRCPVCGLVYANPQPDADEIKDYYSKITDADYLLKYRDQTIARGRRILRLVKGKGSLLDIGCGYGYFLNLARERGWRVYGVELSPQAADYARRKFNLDIFTGDIFQAELEQNSFDLVSLQHVLEHVPDPLRMLERVREILKEDGRLVVVVPNISSLIARLAGVNWVCLAEAGHLFHFSGDSLKRLLIRAGFRPLKMVSYQWNTADLFWAFKKFLMNRSGRTASLGLDRGRPDSPSVRHSFVRRICRSIPPINWLTGKLGLGAEILVWGRTTVSPLYGGR